MGIIFKMENNKHWQGYGETNDHTLRVGLENATAALEDSWAGPQ